MMVKETGGRLNVLEASRAQCFELALTSTMERLSELNFIIKIRALCLTIWGLLAREVSIEGDGEGAEVEK